MRWKGAAAVATRQGAGPAFEPVELSVVIPCRNAADHLGEQLLALAKETLSCSWEIVISDNDSTDETPSLARSLSGCLACRLRVIDASDTVGRAHAVTVAAEEAFGKYLVFLDADDVISPGYVGILHRAMVEHPLVAGILDHETLNPPWMVASRPRWQATGLGQGLYPWAGSGTIGVHTEVFRAVHGFDEGFPAGEDVDLCWRIRREFGVEPHLCTDAVLLYRYRFSLLSLFRQGLHYGRGGARLYKDWRRVGMERRNALSVLRNWAGVARRLVSARSKAELGMALYLLGNRLGLALGSVQYRVLYL